MHRRFGLLDPDNERVQLDTLMKAAAVGKRVRIELEKGSDNQWNENLR